MAGGSQLSQLKGRLRTSGLQRSDSSKGGKKKTKRPTARDPADVRAKKLQSIQDDFNVFDFKSVKAKHAVASNKDPRAGNRLAGKPSLSKSTAMENRRKTLLPEYMDRNRQGGFIDRRFGEDNPHLTPEEKNLERFTRERQRANAAGGQVGKRGLFNLEEEDELTHLGKSLSDQQAFGESDVGLPQEQAFAQFQREAGAALPNAEEEPPRKRSRAEIMEEVVAKSKAYKYERQKARDEDDDLRMELDNDLDALRAALRPQSVKSQSKSPAVEVALPEEAEIEEEEKPASDSASGAESDSEAAEDQPEPSAEASAKLAGKSQVDRALLAKLLGSATPSPPPEDQQEEKDLVDLDEDEFDRYVRELAFEKRARPTNRSQTEEERAATARKELLEQEEQRKKRMLGLDADSDDEGARRKKRKMMPQGDDLDDDFGLVEEEGDQFGLGEGLTESGAFAIEDDAAPESENESEFGSEDNSEDEEEEDDLMAELDEGAMSGEGEELQDLVSKSSKKGKTRALPYSDTAFAFDCPSTHEDFLSILSSQPDDQLGVVIDRIRVLHHPKLSEDNKDKLAIFLGVLIDHVVYLASADQSFSLINLIVPHVFSLSNSYPLSAAQHFVAKLDIMQKNFVRGLSKSPLSLEAKTWPGAPELAVLRLIGLVWSTSDFSHPVVAPALLLICQYLGQSRIRSAADLASGLMLCGLCLQFEAFSKRVIPEVDNFLVNALLILAPHDYEKVSQVPGSAPIPDALRPDLSALKIRNRKVESGSSRLNMSALLGQSGMKASNQELQSLLSTTLSLLDRFSQLYVSSEAFVEIVTPLASIVRAIREKEVSLTLQSQVRNLSAELDRMSKLASSSRRPLRLQQHRAVPIATYLPKFEDNYRPGQHAFDPDTARTETAKLKALLKKEKKGAVRELRKDNKFLANEQARIRQEKDAAYKQKITSIKAGLNAERSEEKEYERTKKKLKALDKRRK